MTDDCHSDRALANRIIDLADTMKALFVEHRPLDIKGQMIEDLYLAGATIIRNLDCQHESEIHR